MPIISQIICDGMPDSEEGDQSLVYTAPHALVLLPQYRNTYIGVSIPIPFDVCLLAFVRRVTTLV
jgi:hypothetical protein